MKKSNAFSAALSNNRSIKFAFIVSLLISFNSLKAQTYYYAGTGALNATTSWGTDPTGTGTAPVDFITASQIFVIQNTTNITHNSGNFSVAGAGSKIVMGNPTYSTPGTASPAINITIAAGSQITNPGNVNFEVSIPSSGNHKIVYQNASAISFGIVNDASTELVFDGNTMTTATSRTYGNVSLINNANVTMSGASIVVNNLLVEAGSTLAGPLDASGNYIAIKNGGSVTINGTLRAGRQGSVAVTGGLYTTGVAIPVIAATTQGTILFQNATAPPALTLGPNSTIDYYRGFGATQTGVQGITAWAYANLTLSNDATPSNRSFGVAGNITVSGTLTVNMATSPTVATITQPSTSTTITLLPSATMVINSATVFPTNSRLTLQSNATGTASIGTLFTGASITGNVNIQKFIPGGFRRYRFLSHPFTTSQALSQLTDEIDITGNPAGTTDVPMQTTSAGFTSTPSNNPSAYYFNTAIGDGATPTDAGWVAFIDNIATTNWPRGKGIRVLVRGTKGQANTLNGTNATPAAVTLTMVGAVNVGAVAIPMVNTATGLNLMGNPYASPVDIGAVLTAAGANVGTTFYLRNPQTESFITVNPIPANYIIPAYSSFFVQALTASNLNFVETNKSTCMSCPTVFKTANSDSRIELKAYKDGLEYDNILFNFNPTFSNNYEKANDGIKIMNNGLNIYSLTNNKVKLAANSTNASQNTTIALGISLPKNSAAQTYQLKVTDFSLKNKKVTLHDKYLSKFVLLKSDTVYELNIDPKNIKSIGDNRLELIIEN